MRAIWKGTVSFGLISIAVKLYSATEEKDVRFHQVHRADGGSIHYQRVCSVCGRQISFDDIAKGYDLGGGEMVILTEDDFADLPLPSRKSIDIMEFVPAEQIDPTLYNKAYYLEPEGAATKPYLLLREAITDAGRVAIVKVTLRQHEQLATLHVRDGVLVLNTMLWPDEVREPDFGFLDEGVPVRRQELAMAGSLVDSMTTDFDPDDFTDDYRAALQQVIDAKVAGEQLAAQPAEERPPSRVTNLMGALRASVEQSRAAREATAGGRGGREPAGATPISAAASASKAKKGAPARKSAPRKRTAALAESQARQAAPSRQRTTARAVPKSTRKTAKQTSTTKRRRST